MRPHGFALLVLPAAALLAACGSTDAGHAAPPGSRPGEEEAGRDGGTDPERDAGREDGAITEPDADDEDGPLWDGKLPSAPKSLASGVYRIVVTADDQLVYTTETAIAAMPVTGGPSSSVGAGAWRNVFRAGRAAIVSTDSGDSLGWSKAAGAKTLSGLSLASTDEIVAIPSASGNRVLVAKVSVGVTLDPAKEKIWILDAANLSVTSVAPPSASAFGGCIAHGESFLCVAARGGDRTEVWMIDGSSAIARATIDEPLNVGVPPLDAGSAAIVRTRAGIYRVELASNDPPKKLGEGQAAILLQGGWLAISGSAPAREVKVMRADGSSARTVATGAGIARWATSASVDTTRLKWLPVCDADAKDERSNLRFVDPETDVSVSAGPACRIAAMMYSDDFALVYDNWVDTPGSQLEGYGDLVALDLRGSARPRVFASAAPTVSGTPISRSRAVLASGGALWFYDANTTPETRAVQFSEPAVGLFRVEQRALASSGIVVVTKPVNATVGDAYHVAW